MKHIAILTAVLSVALIAGECLAQPPGDQPRPRREGQPDQPGQAQRGQRGPGQRGQGQRGPRSGMRDPKAMAKRFMEYDKDGDKKLDEKELTAAFEAMMARRGQGRPGQGRPGRGRPGQAEGDSNQENRPQRPQNTDEKDDKDE